MKTEKNNRLRGTVLFTVVAVMALLIIFLTGTLALATASNNRAHKSYSSSQASYTAKTAITGFTQALANSEEIQHKIVSLGIDGNSNIIHPTITFKNGETQDKTIGLVGFWDDSGNWHDNQITVERVNLTNPIDPDNPAKTEWMYYVPGPGEEGEARWVQTEKVKITATARVGREESTVTAYLTKMPGEPGEPPTVTPSQKTNSGGIKGLNTVGDGVFNNGGRYTGGMGIGLSGDGETNNNHHSYELNNSCELSTTLSFINGDVSMKTSTFGINVDQAADTPVSQTVVIGSLKLANNELVELNYKMDHNFTQKEIPYLYVNDAFVTTSSGGNLITYKGENKQVGEHTSKPASPYNLFVGTMATGDSNYLVHADMYFMDKFQPGTYYDVNYADGLSVSGKVEKGNNFFGGTNQNNSQLYKWAYDTVNKTESQNYSEGGNIFCNGRLHLGGGEYDGDVRVTENLILSGPSNVHIHGDLVVGGKIEGGDRLTVDGHVYCNDTGNYKVGGNNNNNNNTTPTYKRVDNIYVGPEQYRPKEGEEPNWDDLKIIDCAKRDWVRWNPYEHQNSTTWKPTEINGVDSTGDIQIRYYKYNENYCKGITMCKKGGDYTYFYPEEEYNADDYDYVKSVDDIIKALLNNQTTFADPDTQEVAEKWIDLAKVENSWDQSRDPYNCRIIRVTNKDGEVSYRDTSIPCKESQFLIDPVSGDILEDEVPHFVKAAYDGSMKQPVEDVGTKLYTWYRDQGQVEVDQETAEAPPPEPREPIDDNDKIKRYEDYGQSAYPEKMTREQIYGSYTGGSYDGAFTPATDNKIIKNLQEVRQDLGFKKTGIAYPQNLTQAAGDTVAALLENSDGTSKTTAIAINGNKKANAADTSIWGYPAGKGYTNNKDIITGSCVITGSMSGSEMNGNDGNYKAASMPYKRAKYDNGIKGGDVSFDSKVIYINPLGKEIWVVLDNVTMSNELEIHVDLTNPANGKQEGKVRFFIKGKVDMTKGAIINKRIASGSDDSAPLLINMVTHENTDFGMEFYGKPDSELLLTNECTLSGTFKSPYTDFRSSVVGKYRVHYIDEYGVDWTSKQQGKQERGCDMVQGCPCIIGNALFKDVLETQNDFGLYYTETGQTGDHGDTDDQGNQEGQTQTIRTATGEQWFFEFYSAT